MREIFAILFLSLALNVLASEDHDHDHKEVESEHSDHEDHGDEHEHGNSKAIGHGKAIEEVDEHQGFKLSNDSLNFIEIEFKNVIGKRLKINRSALVVNRDQKGIYRLRKGFFKFLPLKEIEYDGQDVLIQLDDLKIGDRIALTKLDLIKICDIYSTDTAEYGHSH